MAVRDVMAVEPWYPRDWLSSEARAVLTPSGRSAYRDLLDAAWLAGGRLRDDDRVLQGLSGLDRGEWEAVREDVLRYFPVVEPGWRANPRQVAEYAKAHSYREGCRAGGKATAAKRWGSDSQATAEQARANRTPSPTPSPTEEEDQKEKNPESSGGPDLVSEVQSIWNEIATPAGLITCRVLNAKRRRVIERALKEDPDPAFWRRVFTLIAADPGCRGQTSIKWKAGIDYPFQSNAARWLDMARMAADPSPPVDDWEDPTVKRQREWDAAALASMEASLAAGKALSPRDAERYARLKEVSA